MTTTSECRWDWNDREMTTWGPGSWMTGKSGFRVTRDSTLYSIFSVLFFTELPVVLVFLCGFPVCTMFVLHSSLSTGVFFSLYSLRLCAIFVLPILSLHLHLHPSYSPTFTQWISFVPIHAAHASLRKKTICYHERPFSASTVFSILPKVCFWSSHH